MALSDATDISMTSRSGDLHVPFTSGLLVGIGETAEDRMVDLVTLHNLHQEYGHLQELIIQPFKPKPGTGMADWSTPPVEDLLRTIAMARILFGPSFNIQAPPNLSFVTGSSTDQCLESWRQLLDAGSFFPHAEHTCAPFVVYFLLYVPHV